MKNLKILITSLILIFALGSIALAQKMTEVNQDEEVSAQDLGISEPKWLPGHPLYFLKNWGRSIQMFFAFSPVKKAELRLKFANEKIIEAEKLAELKKNPKLIEKTLADFQNEIAKISEESGENLKQFSEKLIHQEILHQKILKRLETQVPPEVYQKIKAQREKHLERFAQVMQKVETKEKIAERLENELEKIKGSNFKEFKDLETLTEIEEKMPEEVKKRIEERKAAMTEKFREKLEGMPEDEKEKFKTYLDQVSGNKLEHLEIISNLESEEISDKLSDVLEKAKEEKIDEVEKEAISADQASAQIKKAEDEIAKAEGVVGTLSEEEYGGKAARRLLDLAKKHLEEAKKAFSEGKYGRAFGLATAAYDEALNAERIVQKIGEMKKSPEKMKEKFEKLYPGVELPEDVTKCEIPLMKKCAEGEVLRVEKTEEGCPIFKCEVISKKPGKEKPEVCIQVWDPVCGKDGKTYSNECMARAAGVEVDYKGICKREERKPEVPIMPRGIKVGDWVKYSVSETPADEKSVDWVRVEIKKIEGTKITISITRHHRNGKIDTDTGPVDISKDAFFITSPELNIGDSRKIFFTSETISSNFPSEVLKVSEIETKEYLEGVKRESFCFIHQISGTHRICYDKKTGILLEEKYEDILGIKVDVTLESTNLW